MIIEPITTYLLNTNLRLHQCPPLGLGGLEGVLAGVNLALVLLVPLQEDLRTGHVLRQLLAADGRLHQLNPPHNVAVVGEELLQLVGLVQALPPLGRLLLQRRPVTLQLEAFREYVLRAVALVQREGLLS